MNSKQLNEEGKTGNIRWLPQHQPRCPTPLHAAMYVHRTALRARTVEQTRFLCRRYATEINLGLKSAISSAWRFTIGALRLDPHPVTPHSQFMYSVKAKRTGPRASRLVIVVPKDRARPSWSRHAHQNGCGIVRCLGAVMMAKSPGSPSPPTSRYVC